MRRTFCTQPVCVCSFAFTILCTREKPVYQRIAMDPLDSNRSGPSAHGPRDPTTSPSTHYRLTFMRHHDRRYDPPFTWVAENVATSRKRTFQDSEVQTEMRNRVTSPDEEDDHLDNAFECGGAVCQALRAEGVTAYTASVIRRSIRSLLDRDGLTCDGWRMTLQSVHELASLGAEPAGRVTDFIVNLELADENNQEEGG